MLLWEHFRIHIGYSEEDYTAVGMLFKKVEWTSALAFMCLYQHVVCASLYCQALNKIRSLFLWFFFGGTWKCLVVMLILMCQQIASADWEAPCNPHSSGSHLFGHLWLGAERLCKQDICNLRMNSDNLLTNTSSSQLEQKFYQASRICSLADAET